MHRGGVPSARGGASAGSPEDLVDAATNEYLNGQADWAVNMQISDLLNSAPQAVPLTLDCMRDKIMSKKHAVGLNAVVLLESLVKNVPGVHEYIGHSGFMEDVLVKSLPRSIRKPNQGPSLHSLLNEPSDQKSPLAIQRWEMILKSIAAWSQAFDAERYPIFREVHRMLERRGVRFPTPDKEENAPVFLAAKPRPQASAPPAGGADRRSGGGSQPGSAGASSGSSSSAQGGPSVNAQNDIKSSLETANIFRDMINNSEVGYPLAEDELIQQLYTSCRSNAGVLGARLTRAANGGDVNEDHMMQLLSANETVQEAIKLYEDVVSGVRKPAPNAAGDHVPGGPGGQVKRRSGGGSGGLQESKEDGEFQPQGRRHPTADMPRSAAAPSPAALDPFAVSNTAPPAKSRREDLPADLSQFDMLGLSASPPQPQVASQPQQRASMPPAHQVHFVDPFADDEPTTSFPVPQTNPAALAVVASSPMAGGATPTGPSTGSTKASGLGIAPPPSSTRHRKDSTGKRASGGTPMGAPALGLAPSPAAAKPPAGENIFDLDLLMSSNSPALATPAKSTSAQQPPQVTTFSTPQSAFPFAAAGPVNIFDALQAPTIHAGAGGSSAPGSAGPSSARQPNPFAAFDEDAPPSEPDPFAELATRNPNQASFF